MRDDARFTVDRARRTNTDTTDVADIYARSIGRFKHRRHDLLSDGGWSAGGRGRAPSTTEHAAGGVDHNRGDLRPAQIDTGADTLSCVRSRCGSHERCMAIRHKSRVSVLPIPL
jgi:hypothetical protein